MNGGYGGNSNRYYGQMQMPPSNGMWGGGGGGGGTSGNSRVPPNMLQFQQQQQQQQQAFMLMQQQQQQMYMFHMQQMQQQQQQSQQGVDFNKPTKPGWAESRPGRTPCKDNWWSHVTKEMTMIDSPRGIDVDAESPSRVAAAQAAAQNNGDVDGGAAYATLFTQPPTPPQMPPQQPSQQPQQQSQQQPQQQQPQHMAPQTVNAPGAVKRSSKTHENAHPATNPQVPHNEYSMNMSATGALGGSVSPAREEEMDSADFYTGKAMQAKAGARAGDGGDARDRGPYRKPSLFDVGRAHGEPSSDDEDAASSSGDDDDDDDDEEDDDEESDYTSSDEEDVSGRDMGVSVPFGQSTLDYSAVAGQSGSGPQTSDASTSEVANYADLLRRGSNPNGPGGSYPLPAMGNNGGRARQSNARGYSIPGLSGLLSASDVGAMSANLDHSGGRAGGASAGAAGGRTGAGRRSSNTGAGARKGKKDRVPGISPLPHAPVGPGGANLYSACATPTTPQGSLPGASTSSTKENLQNPYGLPMLLDDNKPHAPQTAAGSASTKTGAKSKSSGAGARIPSAQKRNNLVPATAAVTATALPTVKPSSVGPAGARANAVPPQTAAPAAAASGAVPPVEPTPSTAASAAAVAATVAAPQAENKAQSSTALAPSAPPPTTKVTAPQSRAPSAGPTATQQTPSPPRTTPKTTTAAAAVAAQAVQTATPAQPAQKEKETAPALPAKPSAASPQDTQKTPATMANATAGRQTVTPLAASEEVRPKVGGSHRPGSGAAPHKPHDGGKAQETANTPADAGVKKTPGSAAKPPAPATAPVAKAKAAEGGNPTTTAKPDANGSAAPTASPTTTTVTNATGTIKVRQTGANAAASKTPGKTTPPPKSSTAKSAPATAANTPGTVPRLNAPRTSVGAHSALAPSSSVGKSAPVPATAKPLQPVPPSADAKSAHPAPRRSVTGGQTGAPSNSSTPKPANAVLPGVELSTDPTRPLDAYGLGLDDSVGGLADYGLGDAFNYYMDSDAGRRSSTGDPYGYDVYGQMTPDPSKGSPPKPTQAKTAESRARAMVENLMNGRVGSTSNMEGLDESETLDISGYMYF